MQRASKRLLQFSVRYPVLSVLFVIIITAISIPYAVTVKFNASSSIFMNATQEERQFYNKVANKYQNDRLSAVYLESDNLFTEDRLSFIKKAEDKMGNETIVDHTMSLLSLPVINEKNGTISTNPLSDKKFTSKKQLNNIKKTARSSSIITPTLLSKDGKATIIVGTFPPDIADTKIKKEISPVLNTIVKNAKGKFKSAFRIDPYRVKSVLIDAINKSLFYTLPITILLILLILFWVTKSYLGVFIPILTSTLSLVWVFGFMGFMGYDFNMITIVLPTLLFAIGATEDMHIITIFQNGVRYYNNHTKALIYLSKTVGRAVIATALTTTIGFFAITMSSLQVLTEFGYAAGFGMASNFVITILLNPILLYRYGISAPKNKAIGTTVKQMLKRIVVRHSRKTLLICSTLLAVSIFTLPDLTIENDPDSFLPQGHQIVDDMQKFEKKFHSRSQFLVVLDGKKGVFKTQDGVQSIEKLNDYFDKNNFYSYSLSVNRFLRPIHDGFADKNTSFPPKTATLKQYFAFFVPPSVQNRYLNADSSQTVIIPHTNGISSQKFADHMYNLRQYIDEEINNASVTITGRLYYIITGVHSIVQSQAWGIGIILIVITILLGLLFRGFVPPILAMPVNLAPILFYFFWMVVFSIPLNTTTAMLGTIMIGIAVDDTIHMLNGFYLEKSNNKETDEAINNIIDRHLRPVTATTMSMGAGFLVLIWATMPPTIYFGYLGSAAMVMAFFADLVYLPALIDWWYQE